MAWTSICRILYTVFRRLSTSKTYFRKWSDHILMIFYFFPIWAFKNAFRNAEPITFGEWLRHKWFCNMGTSACEKYVTPLSTMQEYYISSAFSYNRKYTFEIFRIFSKNLIVCNLGTTRVENSLPFFPAIRK
jgi:hypothetical protein